MGYQPLSAAAVVRLKERLGRYVAHDDPAAALVNLVALVVAGNGPLYPLWVVAFTGHDGWISLVTMGATPFFFAIPWLMRRSSVLGRLAIPVVGTLNTVWCTKLFGASSSVGLFFLPILLLACLLYRRRERALLLLALAFPFAASFIPERLYGLPIASFTAGEIESLAALNLGSVIMLMAFLAWQFAALLAQFAGAAKSAKD